MSKGNNEYFKRHRAGVLIAALLITAGCMTVRFELAPSGTIPASMPERPITKSPYYGKLVANYGKGEVYERTQIMYLLNETRNSPHKFNRNGITYSAGTTADHLFKKYRQRYDRILTAQSFIDDIASISTQSGKPYLALPGDGLAYETGPMLQHELDRLNRFMDEKFGKTVHPIRQRVNEAGKV